MKTRYHYTLLTALLCTLTSCALLEDSGTSPILSIELKPFDESGDLDLNGIRNEMADLELFIDYFLKGSEVFTIDYRSQVAQGDVNGDRVALTLGDFMASNVFRRGYTPIIDAEVFEMRIIQDKDIILSQNDPLNTGPVGAILLIFEGTEPTVLLDTSSRIRTKIRGIHTHVLVYNLNGGIRKSRFLQTQNLLLDATSAGPTGGDHRAIVLVDRPRVNELLGNFPNPFDSSTDLFFILKDTARFQVEVFDHKSVLVWDTTAIGIRGSNSIRWDAYGRESGWYHYVISIDGWRETRTMLFERID